ncbi:hypothetical protein KGQ19_06975 [Catenulispora sp. NL8]|uniref:Uncharacterized protein n=1 Tax=Catenulispora pinistramenti TaxID=2705254 RepID=A0ABS5KKN5_9ACTN|nr:hypothetical protein [Catenulispora pinistramenti]MBS2546606.1 hypothetical protein [Catenulispora pinistramenti]
MAIPVPNAAGAQDQDDRERDEEDGVLSEADGVAQGFCVLGVRRPTRRLATAFASSVMPRLRLGPRRRPAELVGSALAGMRCFSLLMDTRVSAVSLRAGGRCA